MSVRLWQGLQTKHRTLFAIRTCVRNHPFIPLRFLTHLTIPDMRLSHTLVRQRRTPCFPQIDLTLRAILYEKKPRFLILFSHQTTSYSQIFFTDPCYVPDEDIFCDYPTGCPNPCCTDDCELIRFPRYGVESATVLDVRTKRKRKRIVPKQMCNWINCDVVFSDDSSTTSEEATNSGKRTVGQLCSKCRLVKYCSPEHQREDWEEHRRVCVKPLI
jgi:hypothetical protein